MELDEIILTITLIGGLTGLVSGIYVLFEKLWLSKPKLNYEVQRNGITNYCYEVENLEKGGYSEVVILLTLSNSGGGALGIGKVLVNSKDGGYIIAVSTHKYENGMKGTEIRSFTLNEEKFMNLVLYSKIGLLFKGDKLDAEIEIYNSKFKILKKIPVELYASRVIIT